MGNLTCTVFANNEDPAVHKGHTGTNVFVCVEFCGVTVHLRSVEEANVLEAAFRRAEILLSVEELYQSANEK